MLEQELWLRAADDIAWELRQARQEGRTIPQELQRTFPPVAIANKPPGNCMPPLPNCRSIPPRPPGSRTIWMLSGRCAPNPPL